MPFLGVFLPATVILCLALLPGAAFCDESTDDSPRKRGYQERQKDREIEIVIDRPLEINDSAITGEGEETPSMRKKRWAMQLRELEELLDSRDIEGLYRILDPDNVVIKLDPGLRRSRAYTREQALLLLRKKWGKGRTTSFRIIEYIGLDSVDETPYVIVQREFVSRPGAAPRTEKIFIFLSKSQGRWIVNGIRMVPR